MYTLKDSVIRQHIQDHYPNARIVSWEDDDSGLEFYTAEQLQQLEGDWFPLCCYKDDATGKAVYGGRQKILHTYTEGETGAGKTTRFAMQSIRALSSMKHKPSFVVVDIHGELVENLYTHLKENGYTVRILNCDDPSHSDTYNPFTQLVKRVLETGTLDTETLNDIRKIAEIMQPVEDTKDPIWDQGARSYTNGCILDKFEDLLAHNIPPEAMTLYNIIENHFWLRQKLAGQNPGSLFTIPHYSTKNRGALSVQKMISVTNNADRTRASYFGVVENHFDVFGQPALYQLSSSNTIDIDAFIHEPTAIFLQSGGTKIGDDLISLLMNEIYSTAVQIGRRSSTKLLPRKIHCFLDEFANSNIADGPEFIKMLTTSRKFGMYWHMLLQCDAQLDRKFDPDMARIIRANCTEIYMGSHDYDTTVRFANSCGQHMVESLASLTANQYPQLEKVDLMTPDRLSLTPEGNIYIKTNRHPLLYSYIEAFYKCPEFVPVDDIMSVYPVNEYDYTQTSFYPDDILPSISKQEYELVSFLHQNGRVKWEDLRRAFPQMDLESVFNRLMQQGILKDTIDEFVYADITPAQMALLTHRHTLGLDGTAAPTAPGKEVAAREVTPRPPVPTPARASRKDAVAERTQPVAPPISADRKAFRILSDAIAAMKTPLSEEDLKPFTCIPKKLQRIFMAAVNGTELKDRELNILRPRIMAYAILDAFYVAHDFKTHGEWLAALDKEIARLKELPFVTEAIADGLDTARKILKEDVTIENIKVIKRLLDDTEE